MSLPPPPSLSPTDYLTIGYFLYSKKKKKMVGGPYLSVVGPFLALKILSENQLFLWISLQIIGQCFFNTHEVNVTAGSSKKNCFGLSLKSFLFKISRPEQLSKKLTLSIGWQGSLGSLSQNVKEVSGSRQKNLFFVV